MKRLIIIAALILAALNLKAQQPADSVSIMLRHLKDTNEELVTLNNNMKTHAALVGMGGAICLAGTLVSYKGAMDATAPEGRGMKLVKVGAFMSATGLLFIAASYLPIDRGALRLDKDGLVVNIDQGKRRK